MAKKDKSDGKRKREAGNGEADPDAIAALVQASRAVRIRLTQQLSDSGLYAGQDALIAVLAAEDGQSPGAIAETLGVRAPTITKTINRMAAQGFLEKRGSEADGRKAHVHLTEKGRQAVASIEKANRRTEKAMLADFSGKEMKALMRLLRRIEENLSQQPADG